MVDFSKLKARKGSKNTELLEKMEKLAGNGSTYERDERIYKPGFDKKDGSGYAVVRLLPAQEGDALVKKISHNFKCKNGFYNETSRASIGEKDPVGISNGAYWAKGEEEGNEALKNIAKKRKQNRQYFVNVYVVKDKVAPENEGKVMIMQFGKQIFDKIQNAIKPEFEDEKPIDPFCMWTGADLLIKIKANTMPNDKGEQITVPNYEPSSFAAPSEFFKDNDEKKEEIFKQTYNLNDLIQVKEFDELAAIFLKRTGEAHDALLDGADPSDSVIDRVKDKVDASKSKIEDDDGQKEDQGQTEDYEDQDSQEEDSKPSAEEDDVMARFRALAKKS